MMRNELVGLTLIVVAGLVPSTVPAQDQVPKHIAEMMVMQGMFDSMEISSWDPEADRLEFFYGDRKNTIHHMVFQKGEFRRVWRSPPLGGTIQSIEIADLDNDGKKELVTYTAKNEAQIWAPEEDYRLRWESRRESAFQTIQAMTVGDVDSDPNLEIVLCADNHIVYVDGADLIVERIGRDEISPARLLIGNVDGDPDDELIASDGHVIDTRSLIIEWSTEPFGYPIYLYDFDGDGALELIGQQLGAIKAWNIRQRREIW